MNQSKDINLIGFTIGLGIFLFIYSILTQFSLEWIILVATITYFSAGLCCGKFWPENPWRWGFRLTIPYIFLIALILFIIIPRGSSESALWGFVFLVIFIFLYFVSFLISSIGAYVGARIGARLRPRPLDKSQDNE
jgi:hypothetical protein